MASLNIAVMGLAATKGSREFVAKASKSTRGSVEEEEKGPFDWIMAGMQKDQLVETDPVLQKKVEEEHKSPTKTTSFVSIPNKKKFGGFGGFFAKN